MITRSVMKTSGLTGAALNWAVAVAEGWQPERVRDDCGEYWWFFREARGMNPKHYHPSTHWGIGGPIIERERICLKDAAGMYWEASLVYEDKEYGGVMQSEEQGATPLVAAMRCYVASKLGDEVQLPEGVYEQQSNS